MPTYETMLVLDPEMSKEQVDGLVEKLKQFLGDRGGEVLKVKEWGVNALAYEINKKNKGFYLLLYFKGGVALVAEMERNLRLMEEVLRSIIVKIEEADIEALQQGGEPEQEKAPEQEQAPEEGPAEDQESEEEAEEQ